MKSPVDLHVAFIFLETYLEYALADELDLFFENLQVTDLESSTRQHRKVFSEVIIHISAPRAIGDNEHFYEIPNFFTFIAALKSDHRNYTIASFYNRDGTD